jgi:VWFA-related protein
VSSEIGKWLGLAMLVAAATAAAQQPTFRSGVDLVTVDAAVHDDDGRPVASLGPKDFRLEVDGQLRSIASAQFVGHATDRVAPPATSVTHFSSNEGVDAGRVIVVAVDEPHIRRLEGKHALVAATRFIESLPESDRVGVVGLTNADTLTLSRDRAALRATLERLTGVGDPMTQQLNLGVSEALEIAEGSRARLADAVLRECGRALTEYVSTARAADDAVGRDACPEQVEQESRAMAQYAHMQSGLSVGALQALIARLKDLPGPKTIVLVSEGMVVDPRRIDLSRLAAEAQAARVTIYGLQLEIPTFEAAQDRVSPTAARDLNIRQDGVARVAGAARGAVFRQVGTDPKPFERISRELSGYYLLAFEARDGDRDGRPHRIRLSLARGRSGQLRARTGFTLPPATPAARGAELTALLRSLSVVTELPLRVATYAYAEPSAPAVRVVVSAEAGSMSTSSGTWLGFVLIDSAGVIAATAAHQAREGRYSFSAVVPPGTYVLRAAAIDPLGRQGSVERAFRVHPGAVNQLHVGDLMLAPPPASPNDPLEPFIDRVSGGQVVAYLETHSSGNAPRPDAVRVHVTPSASNDSVATGRSSVSVREGGWAMARTMVPIGTLPPGSYVARAEILAGGAVVARTVRPFTMVR